MESIYSLSEQWLALQYVEDGRVANKHHINQSQLRFLLITVYKSEKLLYKNSIQTCWIKRFPHACGQYTLLAEQRFDTAVDQWLLLCSGSGMVKHSSHGFLS